MFFSKHGLATAAARHVPWRKWRHWFELLRELIVRDMKVMYKRTVFGIAWSLILPLIQLAIFYFLFRVVFSLSIRNYSLFTFCGILAWNWFSTSINQGVGVILGSRELLRQPGFPMPILPVVALSVNLINFLTAMLLLLFVLVLTGKAPTANALALPLVMVVQFAFTLGLIYFLAALNVIFRDTQQIIGVLLQLAFFMTPIFYDVATVPERFRSLYLLNPMARIVTAYRSLLMHGDPPDWLPLAAIGILSLGLVVMSLKFFEKTSYRFVEEL